VVVVQWELYISLDFLLLNNPQEEEMDVEITIKFTIKDLCAEEDLTGTNLTELVEWMIAEEGLVEIVAGNPYVITKVVRKKKDK